MTPVTPVTPRVTIVDYGMGNILSVSRALQHCGASCVLSGDPDQIADADYLVLPGVGAFGAAITTLRARGLVEPLRAHAAGGRPFLGICIGMQLLMSESEEFGKHEGLDLIPGKVIPIPDTGADGTPHTVPHIGWSAIRPGNAGWNGSVLDDIEPGAEVYFVHSFHAEPIDSAPVLAVADYNGRPITAAVRRDNVTGLQFHPEKSAALGLTILKRFLNQ